MDITFTDNGWTYTLKGARLHSLQPLWVDSLPSSEPQERRVCFHYVEIICDGYIKTELVPTDRL